MHNTISHPETGKSCLTARKPQVPPSLANTAPRLLPQIVPDGPCQGSQALQSPKHQAPHTKSQHRKARQSRWTAMVASRFAPSCCMHGAGLGLCSLACCLAYYHFAQLIFIFANVLPKKILNNNKNLFMLMALSALGVRRLERNLV